MFHLASASHACFPPESQVASVADALEVDSGAEAHRASAVEEYIHGAENYLSVRTDAFLEEVDLVVQPGTVDNAADR